MAFEETREQQQLYSLFRAAIYTVLVFEMLVNLDLHFANAGAEWCMDFLRRLGFFNSVPHCKAMEVVCVIVVAIGTKARKDIRFNLKRMVIIPVCIGAVLIPLCCVAHSMGLTYIYAVSSVLGIVALHAGLDALAKHLSVSLGKDRFNYENESFQQSETKNANPHSVNIPMIFYYKHKMRKGWINIINPFRATIVLGTPGSGKSFGVIDPFIRQHAAKGFAMMVYDYKFPTLAKELYYQYLKAGRTGSLPAGCQFRIINFSDVEYSHRVNPIQRKYIPDLAAASETAATLLAALNKGGDQKKGGSEAFFTQSAENYLASIIYFIVNYHPTGYRNGERLRRYAMINGRKLELRYYHWRNVHAVDQSGTVIYDFIDDKEKNLAMDADDFYTDLEGLEYQTFAGEDVKVSKVWYEDSDGNAVEPDTVTGEFSDMPHVLAFLGHGYDETFNILLDYKRVYSLMVPFHTAFKNKAMDQLEGMVGTLRVSAARLVSPEAYWVFSGDELDLKVSDRNAPSYLVIANDPEKEQVIGALNALVLNRLVSRVNSKGNIPLSIIVDELPTLYFHKIDRLIGTARSNKVSVTLGFQELPQLEADYGKVGMEKIISTCGNILMGAARNKQTLDWASNNIFGKIKQQSESVTVDSNRVSVQYSERMDSMLPASKIADMATGWLAGQTARDFSQGSAPGRSIDLADDPDFQTTKYFCKTAFDMKAIADEEKAYTDVPKVCDFGSDEERERVLFRNFNRINAETDRLINVLMLGKERAKT